MDERTAFGILEISVTKEVDRIKKAYRAVLKHTNPEDDPEGFKCLRTAYETACAYAVSPQEEEEQCSQIDAWIKHAEEIYDSLSKRINVEQWESLLDEEICLDLEIGEEVKDRFFDFLMEHYRLPKKVWELFDQRYFIEEDKQQFLERYPENFVNFMIDQLHMAAGFPYGLFEGADDGDYDGFLNTYFDLYDAVEEEKKELAQLFQALRIEVNGEIDALRSLLTQGREALKPGGRFAIITYHSLEDRLVKNFFRTGNLEGKEDKDFFGRSRSPFRLINSRPIVPDAAEIERNPRSRSAKLRVAEKLPESEQG